MPLLNHPLQLHDIRDTEAHIRHALRTIPGLTNNLTPAQHDDLIADLIGTLWEASLTHDPTRSSFSRRAHHLVTRRAIDQLRRRHGDERYGRRGHRTTVPLDTPTHQRDPHSPRLGSDQPRRMEDHRDDRSTDLQRALTRRARRGEGVFAKTHQQANEQAA